jgi:hypothetical protein
MTNAANVATVMNALNFVLTALTDAFFSLWVSGPAWAPLVVVSAVAGIFAAIVFRFTSRQDLLRRDAELIQAQLLAMKLFRDDLGAMFGSLGRLLRYTAMRLWHSLPPVLVMTVPFVLLLAQLARWYEHSPLVPGDQAIVVLELSEDAWPRSDVGSPESSAGLVIETASLRDPQEHALYWRVRITKPSVASLRWKLPQQTVEKTVAVADRREQLIAVDTRRPGPGWTGRLLHPGEPAFEASEGVRGIAVHYPRRSTPILGLDLPWWGTFLLVSLLAAVVGGRLMKVQF